MGQGRPEAYPSPLERQEQLGLDHASRRTTGRLFRLAVEVLRTIAAGVFHPNPGLQCKDCPIPEPVLGVGVITRLPGHAQVGPGRQGIYARG